jgi:hypothetical protein
MRTVRRPGILSLRRRDSGRWSRREAIIAAGVLILMVAVPVALVVRHVRSSDRNAWPFTVAWDPSWPSLPLVIVAGALTDELAQMVYALAATNADTLQYMPCYCGCREQGHQSVHHCFVKRRSADGRVMEWDGHGRICPMGADIAGDATSSHQQGTPLAQIRLDIEREYGSRGPATPTPPVPSH